jgi:hypothetical protein
MDLWDHIFPDCNAHGKIYATLHLSHQLGASTLCSLLSARGAAGLGGLGWGSEEWKQAP